MQLRAENWGEATIIHAEGERIDAAGALLFKENILALAENAAPRIILDLAQVGFLDSSGLGAIVAVMKMLAPARRLELAALTPPVERVFRLTRMDSVFVLHDALPARQPLP